MMQYLQLRNPYSFTFIRSFENSSPHIVHPALQYLSFYSKQTLSYGNVCWCPAPLPPFCRNCDSGGGEHHFDNKWPKVITTGRTCGSPHPLTSIVSKLPCILLPHTVRLMKQALDPLTLMKLFHDETREEALPSFFSSSVASLMSVRMETLG